MLSFQNFLDLLKIAQQHSRFEQFEFASAKYVDHDSREGERTPGIVWRMKYANLNIKSIRGVSQLTQAEFAQKYGISQRSVESWEGGHRRPPEYVVSLLAYAVYTDTVAEKKTWYLPDDEHADAFFGPVTPVCVDMDELIRLAEGWEMPLDELLDQVHEASEEELAEFGVDE